jgi:Calx-beta domain-containing protein
MALNRMGFSCLLAILLIFRIGSFCLPESQALSKTGPTRSKSNSIKRSAFGVAEKAGRSQDASPAEESARLAIEYLAQVMDQFHNRFAVYDDVSSAGNHFFAWAKFPAPNTPVNINGSFTDNPHSGATAIQCLLSPTGLAFGGFVLQNGTLTGTNPAPEANFGTEPNAGIDLTGATALTFWARGKHGGEIVDFFMGGVGRDPLTGLVNNPCTPTFPGPCPYPDSTRANKITRSLTSQWQQFRIELNNVPLNYVLGGFGWGVSGTQPVEFYLDDIQYELNSARLAQRLNEPRFLTSFATLPFQVQPPPVNDFDLVLRNSAFTYDNAVALLAFLADSSTDSLRRARLIGDALVYASQHDRGYDDGRLRSDYSAGDISLPPGWTPNGRSATVPVSGFYDELQQRFIEVEQKAIDTGNNTWAMIALLALYRQTPSPAYLATARKLGNFIHTFRNDVGTFQGFQGGLDDYPETPMVTRRIYASTEHNLDVYAAFTRMWQITGEPQWQADAEHTRQFVEAMWDAQKLCYLAGTTNPETRNQITGQLPLDVQAWSTLALPDTHTLHPQVLECAEQNHRNTHDGFSGFDFNDDQDGVWFEGTGQMTTAYAFAAQPTPLTALRQELRRAQQTPPFGDRGGLSAASHDGLTTGFDFKYFRRLHVGATAWNIFAQLGINPFYQNIAPTVQFTSATYSAGEGAGSATLTVSRTGDPSRTGTVDYGTSDGTASQRRDYTVTSGTINFAAGETSKSFPILVSDNVYVDGSRTVEIALSDPTGAVILATPSTALLTILDNDSVQPTTNPLDNALFFVRQHYYDFLSREPDAGGLAYWANEISKCGSDTTCVKNRRVDVSNAFFYELEFQQTGAYVYRLYRAAFGNDQPFPNPDQGNTVETKKIPAYVVFVRDRARVVASASQAQAQLDLSNAFVQRPQFLARYPAGLSGTEYVDALLTRIKNDSGTDLGSQRGALVTLFNQGGRGAVLCRLADDNLQTNPINNRLFIDAEYNRSFVYTQYAGYLRRDSDIGGFLFWLGKVNEFPVRSIIMQHAMVCAFITSREYQERFSPVVTRFNSECGP